MHLNARSNDELVDPVPVKKVDIPGKIIDYTLAVGQAALEAR